MEKIKKVLKWLLFNTLIFEILGIIFSLIDIFLLRKGYTYWDIGSEILYDSYLFFVSYFWLIIIIFEIGEFIINKFSNITINRKINVIFYQMAFYSLYYLLMIYLKDFKLKNYAHIDLILYIEVIIISIISLLTNILYRLVKKTRQV